MKFIKTGFYVILTAFASYILFSFFSPAYFKCPFYNLSEKSAVKICEGFHKNEEISEENREKIISLLKSIRIERKLKSDEIIPVLGGGKEYCIYLSSGRIIYFSVDQYQITIDFISYRTRQNSSKLFDEFLQIE